MKDLVRMAVVLTVICMVSATALSQVYRVTKEPIAQAREAEAKLAAETVLGPVMGSGVTIEKRENFGGKDAVYAAMSEGAIKGLAVAVSSDKGYSGQIKGMLGIAENGNVIGYQVVLHSETPGLGANITSNKKWLRQLIFKNDKPRSLDNTDWRVKKDGGEIDALTGATISPRAVVGSIKEGLDWFKANSALVKGPKKPIALAPVQPPAPIDEAQAPTTSKTKVEQKSLNSDPSTAPVAAGATE